VASVFGPVTMLPCPLLLFRETQDEQGRVTGRTLVASGACDPNDLRDDGKSRQWS
jgi:hypothetical protein